jgi:hypothetical protein
MNSQLSVDFFSERGLEVVATSKPSSFLVKEDLMVVFSLFNSPVGIELLDMRAVALWYVKKSPNLMALVESFGPQTIGQWIFACDSQGDCNLTFGIQLPLESLTTETLRASFDYLRDVRSIGNEIFEAIGKNLELYPGCEGAQFMVPQAPKASSASEVSDLDRAWDLVESGEYSKAEPIFRRVASSGDERAWRGVAVCLRDAPKGRTWEEFSEGAIKSLGSVTDQADNTEIALTVASIVLPLAILVVEEQENNHKLSFLGLGGASTEGFSKLRDRIQPWLSWTSNVIDFTQKILLEVELDEKSALNFYEQISALSDKLNEQGTLRDIAAGESSNSKLAQIAMEGRAKHGGQT